MQLNQMRLSGPIKLLLRLLIAGLFGIFITGQALVIACDNFRTSRIYAQKYTQRELVAIKQTIADYQLLKHHLPRTLKQIYSEKQLKSGANENLRWQEDGSLYDGWHQPFVYTVQGTRYCVTSYGQDGKSGGSGLNADLTTDNPYPANSRLTFLMVITDPERGDMVVTACLSGLVSGALCFVLVKGTAFTRQNVVLRIVGFLALLIGTVFITTIITVLHIPTGH